MCIAAAIVGGAVVGGVMSSRATSKAAGKAAQAQTYAADKSAEVQEKMFNETKELLAPYVEAGVPQLAELAEYAAVGQPALERQKDLIGMNGPEAQQAAISRIEGDPLFQSLVRQGEEAMMQSASATGGLRGGDFQGAMAQFRPSMLRQEIDRNLQQFAGLTDLGLNTTSNLVNIGQASAAGQAAAGQDLASNLSAIYGNRGDAIAQAALASGQGQANMWGNIGGSIGLLGTLGAYGKGPVK